MGVNREYKDSVFSWLFSDPDTLRELYGALEGVSLPADVPVTINTLEGVLFKARMNDISFAIGDKLVVLIEHQSTINENMALRLLMYIAKIYEKITGDRDIYREKRISLPRPEFIVLYNGTAPYPDEKLLKLSESFSDSTALGVAKPDFLSLELVVRVYNINEGHNIPLIKRCKTLEGYSVFIAKVREYEETVKIRTDAMKMAIRYCIDHNILKDFLELHSSEVINMLLTEWNWDDALMVREEEGMEKGMEKGQNMVLALLEQGYTPEQIKAKLAATKTAGTETAGK
jgi:hypothetical protein